MSRHIAKVPAPYAEDVLELTELLRRTKNDDPETAARSILTSDWFRDRGAVAAARIVALDTIAEWVYQPGDG